MTEERLPLAELLSKAGDGDFLRSVAEAVLQLLMERRDPRRTAMVRMAEAGAATPQIAAVSGQSINSCQKILDVYLPRGGNSRLGKTGRNGPQYFDNWQLCGASIIK